MLEEKLNRDGQKQIINNLDKIVKIGDKFLQVRLIKTELWDRHGNHGKKGMTCDMPRAKFISEAEAKQICYFVDRDYLMALKKKASNKKV